MIGVFPDPYPDELLYSVFARLQQRMDFPSMNALKRALYGTIRVSVQMDCNCSGCVKQAGFIDKSNGI